MYKCKVKKPKQADLDHWEARLKRMGLTMDAGRAGFITYGHMVADLDFDGRIAVVPATGERLDENEWPISL